MVVINPCDYNQTKLLLFTADHEGPVYLRFGRLKFNFTPENQKFEIGKAIH